MWPLLHFDPDKTTTTEFVSDKIVPYLREDHVCLNSRALYLEQANMDKERCTSIFDKMYSAHTEPFRARLAKLLQWHLR